MGLEGWAEEQIQEHAEALPHQPRGVMLVTETGSIDQPANTQSQSHFMEMKPHHMWSFMTGFLNLAEYF